MAEILVVRNLRKRYGKIEALRNVSFTVRPGEIYGLVGPNGSGKTTTLRIIATLIKPDSGKIEIMGINAIEKPSEARKFISYLPEEAGIYDRLTGWENLLYFALLYTNSWKKAKEIARVGAEIAGLGEDLYRRAEGYSKGMKRRVALARTLMVKPKLTILDEPTSGLDVFSSYEVRMAIKKYARENNASVLISSHNLLEVQTLCDRVGMLYKGELICEGKPMELIEEFNASNLEEAFIKATGGLKRA